MSAMSNHARHGLAPGAMLRKRKERDGSDLTDRAAPTAPKAEPKAAPPAGNRLLAGYLAHEFLTHGTLFGQRWDPETAQPNPAPAGPGRPAESSGPVVAPKAYADVARLLKTDGAHIPGVVNPTQLARWLQMQDTAPVAE